VFRHIIIYVQVSGMHMPLPDEIRIVHIVANTEMYMIVT
jgi:hypothetical protein